MAIEIPPIPVQEKDLGQEWKNWIRKLRDALTKVNSLSWSLIDFSGSNLADIETRNHNDLQSMQGGTSGQYYHLTLAQVTSLESLIVDTTVTSTAVNKTLDNNAYTCYVTASGVTITLPAASSSTIGVNWTVVFSTTGYVTIQPNGSDTITLPTTDSSITLYNKGDSLTFRGLTAPRMERAFPSPTTRPKGAGW